VNSEPKTVLDSRFLFHIGLSHIL